MDVKTAGNVGFYCLLLELWPKSRPEHSWERSKASVEVPVLCNFLHILDYSFTYLFISFYL